MCIFKKNWQMTFSRVPMARSRVAWIESTTSIRSCSKRSHSPQTPTCQQLPAPMFTRLAPNTQPPLKSKSRCRLCRLSTTTCRLWTKCRFWCFARACWSCPTNASWTLCRSCGSCCWMQIRTWQVRRQLCS